MPRKIVIISWSNKALYIIFILLPLAFCSTRKTIKSLKNSDSLKSYREAAIFARMFQWSRPPIKRNFFHRKVQLFALFFSIRIHESFSINKVTFRSVIISQKSKNRQTSSDDLTARKNSFQLLLLKAVIFKKQTGSRSMSIVSRLETIFLSRSLFMNLFFVPRLVKMSISFQEKSRNILIKLLWNMWVLLSSELLSSCESIRLLVIYLKVAAINKERDKLFSAVDIGWIYRVKRHEIKILLTL